jgi:hypothetical protein
MVVLDDRGSCEVGNWDEMSLRSCSAVMVELKLL